MIGIITPYRRCDVTAAALRLADFALSLGGGVKLTAYGRRETNVHPFWDRLVSSDRGEGVYHCARLCEHVVHFAADADVISRARLVAEEAQQVLVPPWHSLTRDSATVCGLYDRVVLPGRAYHEFYKELTGSESASWCKWESGMPPVKREGSVKSGRVRACFYCDASAIDFCGPMVLELLAELLKSIPKLEVGLLSVKSWSRQDRAKLKRLLAAFPHRLERVRPGNLREQATLMHSYDWLVSPGVRGDFASHASAALSCGVPVVANDVYPFDEILTPRHNGLLVSCEVKTGGARAPLAVPSYGKWLEACNKALGGNRLLLDVQQKDWQMLYAQGAYEDFWRKVLGQT